MARMSIDDSVGRDPRITLLSQLAGWSRRETIGCLIADVWPICYDQRSSVIHAKLVAIAAGRDDFPSLMVEAELASWTRGDVRVRITGASDRIRYLDHARESGRIGGVKSAESRQKSPRVTRSNPQGSGNPSVPDVVPDSASASASASAPDNPPEERERRPAASSRSRVKRSVVDYTPEELVSARLVLDRLSERSGVTYTGSDAHLRLIIARLRDGLTAWDLRRVTGYCAERLGWEANPDMRPFLRPETLFGPKTIDKYLSPARTWANYPEPVDAPQLKLVQGDTSGQG